MENNRIHDLIVDLLIRNAIFNRAEYFRDEIMCVRIICGNKFDSVKLQVEDKDDVTIIHSI